MCVSCKLCIFYFNKDITEKYINGSQNGSLWNSQENFFQRTVNKVCFCSLLSVSLVDVIKS